ncbi:MAG: hypothetical protein NAOJABEB_00613 [Steroidobacteraceae bacterium]|nr:hypothetical protein [Steroidobacteraceae bacterium]
MNRIVSRVVSIVAAFFGLIYLAPSLMRSLLPLLPQALAIKIFYLTPRSFSSPMQALVQMSFGVVLLVFAYRRWRTPSRRLAQYTRHQEGDAVRFEVLPATAPISAPVTLFALIFAAAMVSSTAGGIWVLGIFFVAVAALLLLVDQRGIEAGRPRSFRLGKDSIEFNGTLLRRDDIHHLKIGNKYAGNVEIVYDADRSIPTGRLLGLAGRKKLAAVAYRIEIESGGKAYVVAAGLDEVTARGIAAEITKTLAPSG